MPSLYITWARSTCTHRRTGRFFFADSPYPPIRPDASTASVGVAVLPYRSLSLWLSLCSLTSNVRHHSRHVTYATASCAFARTLASLVSACVQAHLRNRPADHGRPRQPPPLLFSRLPPPSLPACLPACRAPFRSAACLSVVYPCKNAYARSGRRVRGGMTRCR